MGEPDSVAAGRTREVALHFAIRDPVERLTEVRYESYLYSYETLTAPVPAY